MVATASPGACGCGGCDHPQPCVLPPIRLSPSVQEFHLSTADGFAGSRTVTAGSDFHRPGARKCVFGVSVPLRRCYASASTPFGCTASSRRRAPILWEGSTGARNMPDTATLERRAARAKRTAQDADLVVAVTLDGVGAQRSTTVERVIGWDLDALRRVGIGGCAPDQDLRCCGP